MNPITSRDFPVDNASILFLSLMRPYHSNNFRISVTLREPVCPEALQKAVDRITPRFPSVIASLQPGFFHYRQAGGGLFSSVFSLPTEFFTFLQENREKRPISVQNSC